MPSRKTAGVRRAHREVGAVAATLTRTLVAVAWLLLTGATGDPWPASASAGEAAAGRTLTVLYTGSTDGAVWPCAGCSSVPLGGLARRATLVQQIRSQVPDLLLVDAGDLLSAYGHPRGDRKMLAIYRLLGYAAVNVGDQEFANGEAFFRTEVLGSGLPLVSASLFDALSGQQLAPSCLEVDLPGARVGVLGVVDAQAFMAVPATAYQGIRVSTVATSLQPHLARLRSRCDLVAVLTNLGPDGDTDLAEELPDIDLVFGAHTGARLEQPLVVGRTLVCRPGRGGEYLGRLDLSLDVAGRIAAWQHELLPVRGSVPADPVVEQLVADLTTEETGSQKQMAPSVATGALHAESERCAGCHPEPAATWRTSAHARAFAGLPPSMQGNLGCLPCHATGWGKGGYVDADRTPGLQGVTCTACHTVPRKHLSWPDRAPVPPVTAPTCRQCHTAERSPDFDFAQYWAMIRH